MSNEIGEAAWYPFVPPAVADAWGNQPGEAPIGTLMGSLTDEQFLRAVERGYDWPALRQTAAQVEDLVTLRALVRLGSGSPHAFLLALHSPHLPAEAFVEWEFPQSHRGFRAVTKWLLWASMLSHDVFFSSRAAVTHLTHYWSRLPRLMRHEFTNQAIQALLSDVTDHPTARRDYEMIEQILKLSCTRRRGRRRIQKRLMDAVDQPRVHSDVSDIPGPEQLQVIANILELGGPKALKRFWRMPEDLYLLLPYQLQGAYSGTLFTLCSGSNDDSTPDDAAGRVQVGRNLTKGPLSPGYIDRLADEVILKGYFRIEHNLIKGVGPQVLQIIQQRPDVLANFGRSPYHFGLEEVAIQALFDRSSMSEWQHALLAGPSIPQTIKRPATAWASDTWVALIVRALEPHLGDDTLSWNLARTLLPEWDGRFDDLVETVLAATAQGE